MSAAPRVLVRTGGRLGAYATALIPRTGRILGICARDLRLGPDHELSVLLCDAATIQRLNRRWRGKDKPTDVLSFPLHSLREGTPPPPGPLGDIILALSVARRQARELEVPWDRHFAHLLIHGLLHLLGYDHMRPAEARRMENEEARLLGLL